MTIRKRAAVVITAVLVAVLVASGCSGDAGRGENTLIISAPATGAEREPLEAAAEAFEAENPGVQVTVNKTPYVQHMQNLRRQISTPQAPDVAYTFVGYGESSAARALADKGLLRPLSDQAWVDRVAEGIRPVIGDGTETYVYPVDSMSIVTFYDPDVFAEMALDIPRTFNDVLGICRSARAAGRIAFAMSGAEASGMPRFLAYALAASTAYADDPGFAAKRLLGEVTFAESTGWQRALAQFAELAAAGCFDDGAVGISRESAGRSLAEGRALMAVAPTVMLPLFQDGTAGTPLRAFPFPGTDDPGRLRVVTGPSSGLVIPAKGRNPDLAKRFIDFYFEHRAQFSELDGSVPAVPTAEDSRRVPAFADAVEPLLTQDRTVLTLDLLWPNPAVLTENEQGLVGIMNGTRTPLEVLTAMDSVWTGTAP
ncbi:ABC transporter substrate-binding protein [Nocardia brevicatena]|uniref:ABC transporter substrate-binding protein n=1 Tax=Nocardia brevicatena TaxID=37327 RepID=UPI0002DEBF47|nr:ABC transporter substrate-binding protein [Nocardia brevicatena]